MRYINKFISYLNEETKKEARKLTILEYLANLNNTEENKEEIIEVKHSILENENLVRMLSVPEYMWSQLTEIFNNFDILSVKLENSPLTSKEKFKIIIRFYEKNIAAHILESAPLCFNEKEMIDYKFKHYDADYLIHELRSPRFMKLQITPEDELSEEDKWFLSDIQDFIDNKSYDSKDIINQNKLVYDHYINKKEPLNITDIEILIKTFRENGISEKICQEIYSYLISTIKKEENKSTISFKPSKEKAKVYTVTPKEYHDITKYLATFIDLETMQPLQNIDINQLNNIIYLLIKLEIPEEKILRFYLNTEKYWLANYSNSVVLFLQFVEKIKFYQNQFCSKENVDDLEMYFKEMFFEEPSAYTEWKKLLEEELLLIIKNIKDNQHTFERAELSKIKENYNDSEFKKVFKLS